MMKLLLFVLSIAIAIPSSWGISYEQDVTLKGSQTRVFQEFKERVGPKLKRDFEKDDLYLLQFLKAKNFNIDGAEAYILEESRWRDEQRMDGILGEEFPDMECCYTAGVMQVLDIDGKPTAYFDLGSWDLRAAVLAGKRDRVLRWIWKVMETARNNVRELGQGGKNVTRFHVLSNLKGFNVATGLTPESLPLYIMMATGFQRHYPNMMDQSILINVPPAFETALNLMLPLVTQEVRDRVVVFGQNKDRYGKYMRNLIDPAELSKELGGMKDDSIL